MHPEITPFNGKNVPLAIEHLEGARRILNRTSNRFICNAVKTVSGWYDNCAHQYVEYPECVDWISEQLDGESDLEAWAGVSSGHDKQAYWLHRLAWIDAMLEHLRIRSGQQP